VIYKLPESVLVVVHTVDLSVLLLERADTAEPRWQSVTGSREPDDVDLHATARRELAEETGPRLHRSRGHRLAPARLGRAQRV
jgi:dATP pyrophosphohydrolase